MFLKPRVPDCLDLFFCSTPLRYLHLYFCFPDLLSVRALAIHQIPLGLLLLVYLIPLCLIFPAVRIPLLLFNVIAYALQSSNSTQPPFRFPWEASDSHHSDMDYILRRCSICFDANLDFFLQNCKDQFCKSCFQRYVHENVKNSWGLVVQPIKCPVCSDVIPKNEWERYVDAKLVRQFERNNKPFRPFIRHCDSCRTDICCAESPVFSRRERKQVFGDMYALLQRIVSRSSDRQILDKFQTDYKQSLSAGNVDHVLVYKSMIKSLKDIVCARYRGNMDAVEASPEWSVMALFSRRFTAIEMQASQWNTLQFLHVSNFPRASCASCSTELCFLCGEQYHPQKSCHEHMQDLLAHHEGSEEVQANLSWKLENSKRCPSCCILITRDEGCNKVSCLYCGYQFCWVCCGKFNDGDCGFYKCSLSLDEPDIPPDLSDFQTELGVPDMTVIGAKLKL